jgi:hypothetical protein
MTTPGIEQVSKMHNYTIIFTSGTISLAPLFWKYSLGFNSEVNWVLALLAFVCIIIVGMICYELALIIEANWIDNKTAKRKDLIAKDFKDVLEDPFLINWYHFLLKGKTEKAYLILVIDQMAYRFLFWLSLLISSAIGIIIYCFIGLPIHGNRFILFLIIYGLFVFLLIFRLFQLSKFLYFLRELSLPQNENLFNMQNKIKHNSCCPCCNNECRTSQLNPSCQCTKKDDFSPPVEGECVAESHIFKVISKIIGRIGIAFNLFIFCIFFYYSADDWSFFQLSISISVSLWLLFYFFNYTIDISVIYYRDSLKDRHLEKALQYDKYITLVGENLYIGGSPFPKKIPERFKDHPSELVAFLNQKQREWGGQQSQKSKLII